MATVISILIRSLLQDEIKC